MTIQNILTKLISYKTVSGNFNEVSKCFDFIREYLGDKFYYKTFEYNKFQHLLIGTKEDMVNFDVLFLNHIDVVHAKDEDFTAKIDGDKLYGRGSIDNKGQVATILHLLKNNKFDKNIGLLLTSDEEIGGHNGAEIIEREHLVKPKLIIVADAGENFRFVDSEKALLQLDLITTGISCHASVPNLGKNAIINALDIYQDLCKHFQLDTTCPVNDNISIVLSKINAGDAYNKVPALCQWAIDIRHSNIAREEILQVLDRICKSNTTYAIHNKTNEFKCMMDNEYVIEFIDKCEKYLGHKLSHIDENGASDVNFFYDTPAVCINPDGYNMHSDNECVILSSLDKFEAMLHYYLS
ncbi:MAG: M20 family metallopeptidase [Clostridiales bacterium]|nr:M20 family metallopeptidase [Clostridiales bacterium]